MAKNPNFIIQRLFLGGGGSLSDGIVKLFDVVCNSYTVASRNPFPFRFFL